ncbi:MAG: transcriptional repressor [Deltaproteobacteria bacterium]|nr:transcriptional repressor [Deltaproteobacteria bacterium]
MTRQRQVILEELCRVKTHPTADDLFMMVRRRIPNISLGTIYRNLEKLVFMQEVRRLVSAGGQMRFDGNTQPHYHIRCVKCGRVDDVVLDYDSAVDKVLANRSGYDVIEHSLEFSGVCPACRVGRESEVSH